MRMANTHDLNHITTHSFLVYPKWNMGGNGNWKSASEEQARKDEPDKV